MPTASRCSATERCSRCAEPDELLSGPLLERVYGIAMERVRLAGRTAARLRARAR